MFKNIVKIHPISLQILNLYPDLASAAKDCGCHPSNIIYALRNNSICFSYYFKLKSDIISNDNNYLKTISSDSGRLYVPILQLNNHNLIGSFLVNLINPTFAQLPGEVFRNIKGFEGLYKISNLGRIIIIRHPPLIRLLNPSSDKDGYLYTRLLNNRTGEYKHFRVHRLVAFAFIEKPYRHRFVDYNSLQINHIDEIKTNNNVNNLEWVTSKENINHGTSLKRRLSSISKPVIQYDLNYKKIREFMSILDAHKYTNVSCYKIRNNSKTSGFVWGYD